MLVWDVRMMMIERMQESRAQMSLASSPGPEWQNQDWRM